MYKIRVENPCSCFLKNGLAEVQDFETKEEAKTAADKLMHKMSTTFCQKHEFTLSERFGDFTIFIKPRR